MSDDSEESSRKELTQFLDILVQNFSLEELRTLCFKLGIYYDDLGGEGLSAKARELIGVMGRAGRFGNLLEAVKEERPLTDWPDIIDAELPSNWETTSAITPRTFMLAITIIAIVALGIFLLSKFIPGAEQPVTIGEPIEVIFPTATPTPVPSSTLAPFAKANEGEALIVVLPFHITSSGSSDAHALIYEAIEEKIREVGLENVRAEIDPNVVLQMDDREAAQKLGESYDAAIIIWGTETRTSVKVNFLNIKEPEVPASDERIQVVAPETLVGAEFVEGHLPEQFAFLSLFAVGQAVVAEGDFTEALPIMEAAVDGISEELIDKGYASSDSAVDAYYSLGWLYYNPPTRNYPKAKDAYLEGLEFDSTNNGKGLGYLGNVHLSSGEYETAIDYYEDALDIARGISDRESEATLLGNLGWAHLNLRQFEKAKEYHEQALAITREIDNRNREWSLLTNLGLVNENWGIQEAKLGNYKQALDKYEESLGNHEQVLAIAREIDNREGEGIALGNLGAVHAHSLAIHPDRNSLEEYKIAIDYFEQSLSILEEIESSLASRVQQFLNNAKRQAGEG